MTVTATVKSSYSTINCISMCAMSATAKNWLNRSLIRQFKR